LRPQLLRRYPDRRQHRKGLLTLLGYGPLGRKHLGEPALEFVELGAVVLAKTEESAGIDNRGKSCAWTSTVPALR
jgi:hypothetical protein